jgi:hypothetical protein
VSVACSVATGRMKRGSWWLKSKEEKGKGKWSTDQKQAVYISYSASGKKARIPQSANRVTNKLKDPKEGSPGDSVSKG